MPWAGRLSVLLHPRIDFVAPGQNAAREVRCLRIAGLLEELGDALRARAGAAVHHDLAVAVNLSEALWDVILRNQLSADLRDLVFVGLAHVDQLQVFASV